MISFQHHQKKKINLFSVIISLIFLTFLTSCAQKNAKTTTVKIKFKGGNGTKIKNNRKNWGLSSPTTISQYNCFGVAIKVPENASNVCLSQQGVEVARFSQIIGTAPLDSTLQAIVPSGPDRTFYVFAFKSTNSFCPSMVDSDLQPLESNLSPPAVLGTKTVSLVGGTQDVSLTASINNRKEFDFCNGPLFDYFEGNPGGHELFYSEQYAYYSEGIAITNNIPSNPGGFTPTTYNISSSLPTGLSFDGNTGIISGTPTAPTPVQTYFIDANDGTNYLHGRVTIAVASDVNSNSDPSDDFYVVNDEGDTDNGTADGNCDSDGVGGNGLQCTLNEAIIEALSTYKPIIFDPSVSLLMLDSNPITNITGNIDILGPGMDALNIDVTGSGNRHFNLTGGPPTMNIAGVTLRGGFSAGLGGSVNVGTAGSTFKAFDTRFELNLSNGSGGAVSTNVSSNLEFHNCEFIGNTVEGNSGLLGGAIYAAGANNVIINDSIFIDNLNDGTDSASHGGAISGNATTLDIHYNYFDSNITTLGNGGAIDVANGNYDILNNTFKNNSAGLFGGAIVINSTNAMNIWTNMFIGNDANEGSHIANLGTTGALSVENNTFVDGISDGAVGAIYTSGGKTTSAYNNLFHNNSNLTGGPILDDCGGGGTYSGVSNNMTDASSTNCTGTTSVTNPGIALDYHMGRGPGYILLSGSPAIDAGTNGNCPGTDFIGTTRPYNSTCDIGAYEYVP